MSEAVQTRVVAVIDDMFFASKIKEAAKSTDVKVDFIKNVDGFIEDLKTDPPTLIIFDLNSKKLKPFELIKDLHSNPELNKLSTLGYFSHVHKDLKKEALEAGFEIVMPRSRFVREVVTILEDLN